MPARGFGWTLPSAPDASVRNPLSRIPQNHSAKFAGQFPVHPKQHHNGGVPNRNSLPARGAFHHHLDEGETPLEPPLPLAPGARVYGSSQGSKAGHEPRRVEGTHRKTMGRA